MKALDTFIKADMSHHLMESLELGKKEADLLVHTFLESIIESLRMGEGIELRDLEASACVIGRLVRVAILVVVKALRSRPSEWSTSS